MTNGSACSLEASYRYCGALARRSASNFYWSFLLLPRPKRRAMHALYAFLRHADDLGDSDLSIDARRQSLADWRTKLERSLAGRYEHEILPALADTVARYKIPPEYLFAVLDGVEMDLARVRYQTFAQLEDYCYHVASVVGLACIHIWGFCGPAAIEPARACGLAFQLTNILRDLKEDADRGRVYLPQEDLDRFGYTNEALIAGVRDERFESLMQFEVQRAKTYYEQARPLEAMLHADGRRVWRAMMATYYTLLESIEARRGDVFSSRIRLPMWRKWSIAAGSVFSSGALRRCPPAHRSATLPAACVPDGRTG